MIISKLLLILLLLKQAPQAEPVLMQVGMQFVFGNGFNINGLFGIGKIIFGGSFWEKTEGERLQEVVENILRFNPSMKPWEAVDKAKETIHTARSEDRFPPGYNDDWRKVRGEPAWICPQGWKWKEDKLHEDDIPHWDVTKGDKKIKEVDKDGRQIWPNGPKNKNKKP